MTAPNARHIAQKCAGSHARARRHLVCDNKDHRIVSRTTLASILLYELYRIEITQIEKVTMNRLANNGKVGAVACRKQVQRMVLDTFGMPIGILSIMDGLNDVLGGTFSASRIATVV